MAILIDSDIYDMYEKLEYNFLYESDLNSIHILLNLYDLEKNIRNIFPKYISKRKLSEEIANILENEYEKADISSKLSKLIHEDINRLELYIYLEGYRKGYFDMCLANKIEGITIKNFATDKLYNCKYLYHFDTKLEEIYELKQNLNLEIDSDNNDKLVKRITADYYMKVVEPKLYSVLDEVQWLNNKQNKKINRKVYNLLLENVLEIYKESYWFGLNDRVLKRYK